ncbi:MAG: ComF family protein [Clostridia bacterium]|nr:ComF family protein [Clostridia bacterium]
MVRKLIIDYKFRDKSHLYKLFSEIIIKNKKICRNLKSYDIIIPVPIHHKRKKERGFNQSELIAKYLATKLDSIKLENKVIIKKINNKKQSKLKKSERIENVKNVYEIINKEKIVNKRIILFDDIYTTGNTVNEISKLLKENGAKEIIVLTIAKD